MTKSKKKHEYRRNQNKGSQKQADKKQKRA